MPVKHSNSISNNMLRQILFDKLFDLSDHIDYKVYNSSPVAAP